MCLLKIPLLNHSTLERVMLKVVAVMRARPVVHVVHVAAHAVVAVVLPVRVAVSVGTVLVVTVVGVVGRSLLL